MRDPKVMSNWRPSLPFAPQTLVTLWALLLLLVSPLPARAQDETQSNGAVAVWDIRSGQKIRTFEALSPSRFSAFSPNGQSLAVAGTSPVIHIFDLQSADKNPHGPGLWDRILT